MLRISKLTDYGMVVMAFLASHCEQAYKAKYIAEKTHISLPTVSKLLKMLARANLLTAQRGSHGGYILALTAEKISLSDIFHAVEGRDMSLTECSHQKGLCAQETWCGIRSNWRTINTILRNTLGEISLATLANPSTPAYLQKQFKQQLALHQIAA